MNLGLRYHLCVLKATFEVNVVTTVDARNGDDIQRYRGTSMDRTFRSKICFGAALLASRTVENHLTLWGIVSLMSQPRTACQSIIV